MSHRFCIPAIFFLGLGSACGGGSAAGDGTNPVSSSGVDSACHSCCYYDDPTCPDYETGSEEVTTTTEPDPCDQDSDCSAVETCELSACVQAACWQTTQGLCGDLDVSPTEECDEDSAACSLCSLNDGPIDAQLLPTSGWSDVDLNAGRYAQAGVRNGMYGGQPTQAGLVQIHAGGTAVEFVDPRPETAFAQIAFLPGAGLVAAGTVTEGNEEYATVVAVDDFGLLVWTWTDEAPSRVLSAEIDASGEIMLAGSRGTSATQWTFAPGQQIPLVTALDGRSARARYATIGSVVLTGWGDDDFEMRGRDAQGVELWAVPDPDVDARVHDFAVGETTAMAVGEDERGPWIWVQPLDGSAAELTDCTGIGPGQLRAVSGAGGDSYVLAGERLDVSAQAQPWLTHYTAGAGFGPTRGPSLAGGFEGATMIQLQGVAWDAMDGVAVVGTAFDPAVGDLGALFARWDSL